MDEYTFMRLLFLLLCAGTIWAGEAVLLANGSRLHADRHEIEDGKVRLYTGKGYIELNAIQVQGFEAEPSAEAVPAVPVSTSTVSHPDASPPTPDELADRAADKYGLPRWLIRSVM